MNQLTFTKMHGLGNNYIYVNMFEENLKESQLAELAIKISNVNTGIGSDGMILICPSEVAAAKMRIFNNDGSEGKNCGNGLRCVAKYVYEHKIVSDKAFPIETLSGVVHAQIQEEEGKVISITIDMGKPQLKRSQIPMVGDEKEAVVSEKNIFAGEEREVTLVSMGNPHAIFYVEHIDEAPLTSEGPLIEKDARFPEGINVEYVEVVNDHELHFRVWERGSGITQACGTGACAAVVASVLNEKTIRNKETLVHLAGGDLRITWTNEGNVMMTGPAETICTGTYYY
ncbi:diaminopimelate epimerase [Cytobacillus sp. IB215316]|uniref:diaminopimelate epimerase n=1 Tax=Cytobacillus sp. IB215316 TaxID=3097354 RepID=UPI002A13EFF9|nr:diaminopimelate epimerase [Cytobacillus sp. IB215316]MDX8360874.1 diaminopimelate epimerase [Cytobacillus sp. IB215316]